MRYLILLLMITSCGCASIPASTADCRQMCGLRGAKHYQQEKTEGSSGMSCDCQ